MARATADARFAGGRNVVRPLHLRQRVAVTPPADAARPAGTGRVVALSRGGKVARIVMDASGESLPVRWRPRTGWADDDGRSGYDIRQA
jgi:hypothetical protein